VATIEQAKQAAVQEFLTGGEPAMLHALAASTNPRHNVTGIGRGPKIVNGVETAHECLRFYVERKIPESAIPAGDILPSVYQGVPTDVIETGRFLAGAPAVAGVAPLALPGPIRGKLRPTRPGCSVGFQFPAAPGLLMAGTYGAVVTDGENRFVLSNNHVLADENNLPPGSPIFQPGLLDGGNPATDRVAVLTRFIPIDMISNNVVDAAIAQIFEPASASPEFLPNVGHLSSAMPVAAARGMQVEKVGRTTGFTQGDVFDDSATIRVIYTAGTATFDDQVLVRGAGGSFSAAGDSGSVIVDSATRRATALLFAGSATLTIGNKIERVLAELGVTLVI
jgi:hypothetical protein